MLLSHLSAFFFCPLPAWKDFFIHLFCCSVTKSCPTLWSHGLQHARLPFPSLSPRVCPNSCPLSHWFYLTISSSAIPFSSCPQSFPASRSFPMSQLFVSGGQVLELHFSISPSSEYSRLISFRTDWIDLLYYVNNGPSQLALVVKNPPASAGDIRDAGSILGSGRSPEEGMATHSSGLPGDSHGQRSLVGYSCKESNRTEVI